VAHSEGRLFSRTLMRETQAIHRSGISHPGRGSAPAPTAHDISPGPQRAADIQIRQPRRQMFSCVHMQNG
jgi:hypothetical protein